jgi:hypothetical protein
MCAHLGLEWQFDSLKAVDSQVFEFSNGVPVVTGTKKNKQFCAHELIFKSDYHSSGCLAHKTNLCAQQLSKLPYMVCAGCQASGAWCGGGSPNPVPVVQCTALSIILASQVCTTGTEQEIFGFLMSGYSSIPFTCIESLTGGTPMPSPGMRGGPVEACEGFTTYSSTSGSLSIKLDNSTGSARSCSFLIMPEWFNEGFPAEGPPPQYAPAAAPGSSVIPPPLLLTTPSVDASVTFTAASNVLCKGALVGPSWVLTTASCCADMQAFAASINQGLYVVTANARNDMYPLSVRR